MPYLPRLANAQCVKCQPRTFRHLHNLSLKYHLSRKTGGLSRIISRGINGVDSVLRFALFNTIPTGT